MLENFQNEEEGGNKVIFCVMDVVNITKKATTKKFRERERGD